MLVLMQSVKGNNRRPDHFKGNIVGVYGATAAGELIPIELYHPERYENGDFLCSGRGMYWYANM